MKLSIEQNGKNQDVHLNETPIRVGRSPEFELCFNNPQVSRFHCIFWMEEGRLWIQDQGSANGTFVDDVRLESKIRLELKNNQEIKLGKSGILIKVHEKKKEKIKNKKESTSDEDVSLAPASGPQVQDSVDSLHNSPAQTLLKNANEFLSSELVSHKQENFEKMTNEMNGLLNDSKLKANEVIESAHKEVEKLKQETQSLCIDRLNQAEKEATHILTKAQKESIDLIKKAKEESTNLITEAQKKSFEIQKKSQEEYHSKQNEWTTAGNKFIHESQQKAAVLFEEANKKVSQIIADSQNEAVKIKTLASKESEDLINKSNSQAREIVAKAQESAKNILNEANKKSEEKIQWSLLETEKNLEEGRRTIKELRQNAETEIEKIKTSERERCISEAEDDIKKMYEKAQVKIDEWIQQAKNQEKSIQDQIAGHNIELETLKNLMQDLNETKRRSQAEIQTLSEDSEQMKKDLESELKSQKEQTEKWCLEQKNSTEKWVSELKSEAETYAKKLKQDADKYLEHAQNLDSENNKLQAELNQKIQANQIFEQEIKSKQSEAELNLNQARTELEQAKRAASELKHQADEDWHKAQKQAKDLREKVELEATEKRKQMEESSVKGRIQAEEDLTKWLRDEQLKIKELRRQQVIEFEKNILGTIIQVLPKGDAKISVELEKSIHEIAKKSFVEVEHELLTAKKSFYRKWRFAIQTCAASLIAVVAFFSGSHWTGTAKHLASDNQSNYLLKKIREQRENAPKFNPKMDYEWKNSYAENILHTKDYALIKLNESVKDQWIISLNKLFLDEFELKDEAIVKFITMENNLIRELMDLRKVIIPEKESEGIQKLKEAEAKFKEDIVEVIGNKKNIAKILEFEKGFLQSYLSSAESLEDEKRGLASQQDIPVNKSESDTPDKSADGPSPTQAAPSHNEK